MYFSTKSPSRVPFLPVFRQAKKTTKLPLKNRSGGNILPFLEAENGLIQMSQEISKKTQEFIFRSFDEQGAKKNMKKFYTLITEINH